MTATNTNVRACFGKTYCAIREAKCLGKDTSKLDIKLKKLFLAQWLIGCNEGDCDIECFLSKNCNC